MKDIYVPSREMISSEAEEEIEFPWFVAVRWRLMANSSSTRGLSSFSISLSVAKLQKLTMCKIYDNAMFDGCVQRGNFHSLISLFIMPHSNFDCDFLHLISARVASPFRNRGNSKCKREENSNETVAKKRKLCGSG